MNSIKIYIVDDHALVIAGLQNLLKTLTHIEIVGEFTTGKALLDGLENQEPDVILLDILLPDINGKELAAIVKQTYRHVRIIALSSLDAPQHVKSMMRSGCDGYLLKNADREVLQKAIETVCSGGQYIEATLEKQMLNSFINFRNSQKIRNSEQLTAKLTKREKEILSLIVREHTNQEIANMLFLSVRTVEFHRQNLQQKLDVKSPMGLLKAAIDNGLV